MQVIRDDKHTHIIQVRFTTDEYRKIVLESTRTGRLVLDIVLAVLAWGLEHYKYTTKQNASYGS